MEYQKEIEAYMDAHADELVADTMELCRINSEKGEAREGMPFGEGPCAALKKAEEICARYGFAVKDYDHYVMTADLNEKPRYLDVLAHTDVVAGGDGWTVTDAFTPIVRDGKIYGRGTSDDKGPAMAALYAMRAVKELGIPVSKNCRLILGSDEESGSDDIRHYYASEEEAEITLSPDTNFPLINVEKGFFRITVEKQFPQQTAGGKLISLVSGGTINIVPGKAELIVEGVSQAELEAACQRLKLDTGVSSDIEKENTDGIFSLTERFCVKLTGKGSHASHPQGGRNAALAALRLAASLPLADSGQTRAIRALAKLFPYGDHYGDALGCRVSDELSGDSTFSLNILRIDETALTAKADCRVSVAATKENTIDPAERCIRAAGLDVTTRFTAPHVVSADLPFIGTLLSCYEAVTGEPGKTASMGGGTYVHGLKRGVAFGAVAEGTDTHMHGADEFMVIEELKTAAKIYALAISELCR